MANHTSGDVLERVYIHHSYDEEAREAWAKWGAYLDALITGAAVVELRPGS